MVTILSFLWTLLQTSLCPIFRTVLVNTLFMCFSLSPSKPFHCLCSLFFFFYFLYQTDICFFVSFFFCCTTGEESGLAWNIYRKRLVRRASSGTNTPSQNRQHSRACQHVALYYSSDGLSLSYATAISRLKYHRLHISKTHCTDISPFGVVKFCRVCQCVRRIWLSFGMLQSCCGGAVETVCCFQALAESTGYLQLWDFPNFPELVPRD